MAGMERKKKKKKGKKKKKKKIKRCMRIYYILFSLLWFVVHNHANTPYEDNE